MQTGFRELQRFRGLSREIARLVSMEGFRQRKSARIELQISKINGYSTKHLARGLGAATEERTVAKSQESDQKKGKGQDLTDNLTTSGTVVELDERTGLCRVPEQKRKRRTAGKMQETAPAPASASASAPAELSDLLADVPQPVPGKIKNAKRKRAAQTVKEKFPKKPPKLTAGAPSAALSVWTEAEMAAAVEHLKRCDPGIAALASEMGSTDKLLPKGTQNMFASLARSIAGQQLATQAAFKIHSRFVEVCKRTADDPVQPSDVMARSHEELRSCGFSGMKANYIHDLARHFDEGLLSDGAIAVMDDETLITELTKVKGIGRWSVDMFAMFHLGRIDVLPVGDLGIRNGMKLLYGLPGPPKADEMERLTESWRPYRSLGCYYLWGFLGKKTAEGKKIKTPKKAAKPVDKVPL